MALNYYTVLYKMHPSEYINDVIESNNRPVWRLLIKGNIDETMNLSGTTYAMNESNEQSKYCLAECYNTQSLKYANAADFDNAYACIDKAIAMFPDNSNFYDSKGEILLMQGRNDEALGMWKKVQELNLNFLDNYPDGTNLSNGLKKLGLLE